MRRFFGEQINPDTFSISGEEYNHLKNVLRLNIGDDVCIILDDIFDYHCKISQFNKFDAVCKLVSKEVNYANPKKDITLFMGLSKGEKMSLIAQKATELGITTIIPFISKNTVKEKINVERLNKIVEQACKQCGRSLIPKILSPVSFDDLSDNLTNYDMVMFAYEKEDKTLLDFDKLNKLAIIIGSEGGFTEEEAAKLKAKQNVLSISLGSRVLRCETAAISLMGYVSLLTKN